MNSLDRIAEFFLKCDFERRATAYLSDPGRRIEIEGPFDLADTLDDAADEGRLTEADYHAISRASALERLGRPVVPIVAGERIDPKAAELAGSEGVRQILVGQAGAPRDA